MLSAKRSEAVNLSKVQYSTERCSVQSTCMRSECLLFKFTGSPFEWPPDLQTNILCNNTFNIWFKSIWQDFAPVKTAIEMEDHTIPVLQETGYSVEPILSGTPFFKEKCRKS